MNRELRIHNNPPTHPTLACLLNTVRENITNTLYSLLITMKITEGLARKSTKKYCLKQYMRMTL